MNDNGIYLVNAAHPKTPWWKRILSFFRRVDISESSLETIEIEVSEGARPGESDLRTGEDKAASVLGYEEPRQPGLRPQIRQSNLQSK